MLRSMTGFSQVQYEEPPLVVRVTLRALNHRFLDLHVRLAPELEGLEPRIRNQVRAALRRGHVDVNLQVESSEKPVLSVDREYVRSYVELFNALRQEHRLTGEPDLMAILRMPGVVQSGERPAGLDEDSQLARITEQALGRALEELERMRRAEGAVLEEELRTRARRIQELVDQVAGAATGVQEIVFARLREKLQQLLDQAPLDEARVAQEAAYLAERSDVSEEVARLRSHLEQFLVLLGSETEVGKRLDFLLQEMSRETNTLLSKSPAFDAGGMEVTRAGLAIKAEIERLREQVQNVE